MRRFRGTTRGIGWHARTVRAPEAWRHPLRADVVVAVIDQSIDDSHPEFAGRVTAPRNVDDGSDSVSLGPYQSHGTSVAGVALAQGRLTAGIAPEARLMPVAVPSLARGTGGAGEARALDWAVEHGADVIVCAWGPSGSGPGDPLPGATAAALSRATTEGRGGKGCVLVFSAGNDGTKVDGNPYANHPDVVTVGACNARRRHAPYSNTGRCLWFVFPSSDHRLQHASTVLATKPWGSALQGYERYGDFGFTSAAAAGVAGVAALVLGVNPALRGSEVREVLRETAVRIDARHGDYDREGHSPRYGYGMVDAAAAVVRAMNRGGKAGNGPTLRAGGTSGSEPPSAGP